MLVFLRLLCWIALAAAPATAFAQAYPSKPIHLIVPFPAGGPNDFFARVLGNKLSPIIGQPIVVENKAGATGTTGVDFTAKSTPDGYTVVVTSMSAIAIVPAISTIVPYDPFKDLAPITIVAKVPEVLVAIPKLKVHTLAELVKYAKANPGKINFASAGTGGLPHLAAEELKRAAGIDIVHVPYKGAAPAVNDLVGGHVDIMFADLPILLPQIQSGNLIALTLGSAQRAPTLPDVPTTAEVGYPDVLADNWYGMFVPAATPQAVQRVLYRDVVKALKDPEVQSAYAKQGATAVGNPSAEFAAFIRTEYAKWGGLAQAIGVKID